MKLGINLHSDWAGCPNLKWLKTNTIIKNVRLDFPCELTFENPRMLKQLDDVLNECNDFENIVLHVGYLDELYIDAYKRFNSYIEYIVKKIVSKRLAKKATLELWNNVNLSHYWNGNEAEFRYMLSFLDDSLKLARNKKIKISGFSFTLNHESGWDWLWSLQDVLESYNFITVQLYPEQVGQYIEIIDRLEKEYPEVNYIVTETGHMGNSKEQYCLYRQLMYEIEKATPDKLVFLYHLFDNIDDCWELISWQDGKTREKKSSIYLKQDYPLATLRADRPKDFFCCKQRKWWKKITCLFKRIF